MRHVVAALVVICVPAAALAQETSGVLQPTDGGAPLQIESQEVLVRISNGIAVTTVTQIFRNNRAAPLEAVYSFPIPNAASVSNLSLWIDGKEAIGEVLEKREARRIYDQITSQRKDPGLLEQVSYKLFELRVFPVPARGTQRIQIAYYQPVDHDSGFGLYVYPLEAKTKEHSRVSGTFRFDLEVDGDIPIKSVESPSHRDVFVVRQVSKNAWRASAEIPRGALDRDFVLAYEHERERTRLTLVPYRDKDDGFFMLMLTAGEELDRHGAAANYTFVLDVSGSMSDHHKLQHAVQVVEELLKELGETDRFNIVSFNIAPELFEPEPVAPTEETRRRASDYLRRQIARGGTDLLPALDAAARMRRDDMPSVLVLLSDGNSTDADDHSRYRALDRSKVRVFSVGIGNEVNRPLLDALAQATGGYADVISSQDDLARKVRLLKTKIRHHAAEDLAITFRGADVYDVTPARFPNLFRGQQVVIFGRYRGAGAAVVIVKGKIAGKDQELSSEVNLPGVDRDNPEVRRMWAWRRTDDLMQAIRSQGEDASKVREIVDLGMRYSIVTPYTSFLVLESEAQYGQFGIERRNARQIEQERRAQDRRIVRENPPPPPQQHGGGGGRGGSVEIGFFAALAALIVGGVVLRRSA